MILTITIANNLVIKLKDLDKFDCEKIQAMMPENPNIHSLVLVFKDGGEVDKEKSFFIPTVPMPCNCDEPFNPCDDSRKGLKCDERKL